MAFCISTLNVLPLSLVSDGKSVVFLIIVPLFIICIFLWLLSRFSPYLWCSADSVWCNWYVFFCFWGIFLVYVLLMDHWVSQVCKYRSSTKFGEVSALISSKIIYAPISLSSSGISVTYMLGLMILTHSYLRLMFLAGVHAVYMVQGSVKDLGRI